MPTAATFPNIRPTLLLNFANAGRLSPLVTFTRASNATYFDETGILRTAANNTPRFDYNPATLAAQGLLIEEQRTNGIRNNTMQGAVAGTPGTLPTNWGVSGLGTLTQQVVGTGTVNGINYIDLRFSGTTSTTQINVRFEPSNVVAATNGQTWTGSSWCAVTAGSLTNIASNGFNANIYDAASVYLASVFVGSINTTSTLTRTTHSGTIASATAAFIQPQIYLLFSSGVAIDITLRIGLPQLEQGAFATSVIPTTTTALTRSADVASVDTLTPWFNASEGALFSESQQAQNSTAGFPVPVGLSGALGGVNCIEHIWNNSTSTLAGNVVASSSVQANIGASGLSRTAIQKFALSYKANDFAACVGGGAVATDTSGTIPVVDRLVLGARPSSALILNGWIQRITYYPRRLSNAELQAITS